MISRLPIRKNQSSLRAVPGTVSDPDRLASRKSAESKHPSMLLRILRPRDRPKNEDSLVSFRLLRLRLKFHVAPQSANRSIALLWRLAIERKAHEHRRE
jgi:hypothetical protein